MPKTKKGKPDSAFLESGFQNTISHAINEVVELYKSDEIPWVVGYSGGKDSTATLQLVWSAILKVPKSQRKKPIYVISTDTLVENPIVALWVSKSLEKMSNEAKSQNIPITSHRLTPEISNTFWVNLIGRGYAAPRPKFRWCTERLKIMPSSKFINEVVQKHGEAILVLGSRKAESVARAKVLTKI